MSTIFGRVSIQKDLWEKDLARVYKESLDLVTVKMAPAYLATPSIPIEELDDPSVPEVYKNAVRIFLNIPTIVATGILFSYIRTSRPVIFSEWSWDSETTKNVDIPFISVKPSAEEIFDGFKMVCPLAVPIIIDQLDCTLQEKQLLKSAYNDNQRDSFVEVINNLTCDITVLSFFSTSLAFHRWLFIMMFTNPQAISDVVYHSDQFNLSKIIKDSFISEEELVELDRLNKELESLRGKPHKSENGEGETFSLEQEEEARANAEQMVSGAKQILVGIYVVFKEFEEQLFPFEKKYYYDLLELPGAQPLVDDIAKAYNNDGQKGPVRGQIGRGKNNKSNAGSKPKPWIQVSMREDVIKKKLEEEVWNGIKDDIEALDYLDKSGVSIEKAQKAFGAAFMFYSAYSLGLTVEKKYSQSAERAFSFLPGPRTSVNDYLDKLHLWFTILNESQISRKRNIDNNTFKQWKNIDKFKAEFIINNYTNLAPLFNKTKFLLGKAFGIETGIELEEPDIPSDPVLDGAKRYDDNVGIKNDGHKSKTGLPLSYSDDK